MTRHEMKTQAREAIHGTVLLAALACFIMGVICNAATIIIPAIGVIILQGPLEYGLTFLFVKNSRDGRPMNIGELFKGFSVDFGGTLLLALLRGIFTFLWSLLLFFPGLVKSYAYSMAFYLKCDHNDYDWSRCLKESEQIMIGHKMELFLLDLSFIGWYLLASLTFGILLVYVVPYHSATKAQFYNSLVAEEY